MIRQFTYRIILIVLIQSLFLQLSKSQNEVRVIRSEFKTGKDSVRQAFKHIRMGNALVKKGKGDLSYALDHYLKAYQYNSTNPELNYKIGKTYLRSCPKEKALSYLKSAYDKDPKMTKDLPLLVARAYQYNLKFDSARLKYESYLKSLSKRQQRKQGELINKFELECRSGAELSEKPKRAVVTNAGNEINSAFDDYNAFAQSDSMLYFTSRRPSKKRDKPSGPNDMYDEDIYVSTGKNGEWQSAVYLKDDDFNSKHNEAIVWVSEDGKTRYKYDGYVNGGDILVSYFKKGEWSKPKKISRKFRTKGVESSVSVTRDGNTIYFVSDDEKECIGGKDIYVSTKDKKGRWEKPKNVGSVINSKYDEEGVYVNPDGNVMYFSSKGHNSMGGYDIFRSEKDAGGRWSKPENIGFPVNTPDDELFYRPSENERSAWFSDRRADCKGGFDIYKVIYLGSEKKLKLSADQQLIAYVDKPISDIFARISGEEVIETFYMMSGLVTDAKKKTPVVSKIDLIDLEKSTVIATTLSDSMGNYKLKIPENKKYGLEIHAKDYMLFLDAVTIPATIQGKEFNRNFALAKVEAGTKIVLKNIYFETGKAVLTAESYSELDKVVKFLQENTEIKVEISGHTDNVGNPLANTKLSEARAKAVVEYISGHGINPQKLVYKGYGLAQPIASNKTAAGRKLNRRVEFKILSVE